MKTPLILTPLLCLAAFGLRAADPVRVASFSTVTTWIASEVGGDRAQVAALVKPGIDPHSYEPTPGDLKQVGQAQLILASGKHLENYTARLRESAAPNAVLIEVGNRVPSLQLKTEADEKAGSATMIEDPHWWQSIGNVRRAVVVVRDALIQAAPADKTTFEKNADATLARLDSLEKWVKSKIAELPRDRRKLVTSHDAFQYFAKDFGFTIYPVKGVNSSDEPSSKNIAALVQTIREQKVKAVFFESIENPKVLREITDETGAKVGGELVADGLGTG
ncbi:MAG: metal ABC transporter substrate-binding protein, partial [Verrucomicrobiota bacterium]